MKKGKISEYLRRLRDHNPPDGIWTGLEMRLEREESFGKKLKNLKTFEPDEASWTNIIAGVTTAHRKKSLVKWGIAASVAVLLLSGVLLSMYQRHASDMESLAGKYHSETDETFASLQTFCLTSNIVCLEPEFISLRNRFESLQKEFGRVRKNAGRYDSEAKLLRQLRKIEAEKTEILNQMSRMI